MGLASKDSNGVASMIGALNSDGTTVIAIKADSTTHALEASDGTSGTDKGPTNALKDVNSVSTLLAVSSSDGKTIVPLYVDSSGNLLVKST